MQQGHFQEFDLPGEFDLPEGFEVDEVNASSSEEEQDVVDAGYVGIWEQLIFAEKVRVRPYLSSIVISVWAICAIASLIRFIMTGDFLFLGSPALLLAPLNRVLKFYFKSD